MLSCHPAIDYLMHRRKQHDVDNLFATFDPVEFEDCRRFYPRWTGRRDKVRAAVNLRFAFDVIVVFSSTANSEASLCMCIVLPRLHLCRRNSMQFLHLVDTSECALLMDNGISFNISIFCSELPSTKQ